MARNHAVCDKMLVWFWRAIAATKIPPKPNRIKGGRREKRSTTPAKLDAGRHYRAGRIGPRAMTGGSPERSVDRPSLLTTTTTKTTTMTKNHHRAAGGGGGPPSASHRETMDRAAADPPDPAPSSNSKTTDARGYGSPPRAGLAPSFTVSSFFLVIVFLFFFSLLFAPGENGIMDHGGIGDDSFRSGYILLESGAAASRCLLVNFE